MKKILSFPKIFLFVFIGLISANYGYGQGRITTVAGNGLVGYGGDGGPATSATFNAPIGVSVDTFGNIYIVDCVNQIVRKVNSATGIVTRVAGTVGISGWSGDGGPATNAQLDQPYGTFVDKAGNIYICDAGNDRVRMVNASTGIITRVAGNSLSGGYSGDGGLAISANLSSPSGVWVDDTGNIFIADEGNQVIRKVKASTGVITTIAGNGTAGYSGDGGPATAARLMCPFGVTTDRYGNVYIGDNCNHRVRKVDAVTNNITTIAGTGTIGCAGVGGPATSAQLNGPFGICLDTTGNIYISESGNGVVKKINHLTGVITNYARICFSSGPLGDGGPATAAQLNNVNHLSMDKWGNLYIADRGQERIRKVGTKLTMFTGGIAQTLNICVSTPTTINSLMSINDQDVGLTETWTVNASPSHGMLSGFPYTATSTGGTLTPTGLFYTPTIGYTGTDVFKVQISNGFDSMVTTVTVTINPVPVPGTIVGPAYVCTGVPITFTNPTGTSGGIWVSSNPAVATIGSGTGTVFGVAIGMTTISYTITNICGTATTTKAVTVNPTPVVTPITGVSTVCSGSTITLSTTTVGGVWSSSNLSVATVGSTGIVTGVATGIVTISYTVTNVCGSVSATKVLTVNASPVVAPIAGLSIVCSGLSISLSSSTPSGTWTSASPAIATVGSSSGLVTGVSSGVTMISYTVINACGSSSATLSVTVSSLPIVSAITGPTAVCPGHTILLSSATPSGTWHSSVTTIATVGSSSGVVNGVAIGSVTISYTVTNICGSTVVTRTVSVLPVTTCALAVNGRGADANEDIIILPNPNNGTFSINMVSFTEKEVHIIITDLLGRKVKELSMVTNVFAQLQIEGSPGIYLLTATTANEQYTRKVIIN